MATLKTTVLIKENLVKLNFTKNDFSLQKKSLFATCPCEPVCSMTANLSLIKKINNLNMERPHAVAIKYEKLWLEFLVRKPGKPGTEQ